MGQANVGVAVVNAEREGLARAVSSQGLCDRYLANGTGLGEDSLGPSDGPSVGLRSCGPRSCGPEGIFDSRGGPLSCGYLGVDFNGEEGLGFLGPGSSDGPSSIHVP